MVDPSLSRRRFVALLGRGAAAPSIVSRLPWLALLDACARGAVPRATLTARELRTLRAFAAQIIPSDTDATGAADAGAAEFIDRALARPLYSASLPDIRRGLADLDARARRVGADSDFASANDARQRAILQDVQSTPFFTLARTLVVVGTFADPSYGGNRGGAAWKMLGIEHAPSYSPPFGWYDAAPLAAS
jgi:gluconate 2-dehydrogenase gamma chain